MREKMEYDNIKQLMDAMGNSGLSSISIDFPDGLKISMTKDSSRSTGCANEISAVKSEYVIEKSEITASDVDSDANIVVSPMVGTFYAKPSPTSNPYVEVGKRVKKGDVLCIVEAMKLMNEIESEFDGEIVEVLVNDGEVVEYGMPLFKIK